MTELDIKRLYMPEPIMADCPDCNHPVIMDYLSYPTVNCPFEIDFYCGNCEKEFVKTGVLTLKLDIDS
jgi:hypothetical protein